MSGVDAKAAAAAAHLVRYPWRVWYFAAKHGIPQHRAHAILRQIRRKAETRDVPDVARPVGVAEVADTCTGAAGLDGGFVCWVPHDHDVPDVVGS